MSKSSRPVRNTVRPAWQNDYIPVPNTSSDEANQMPHGTIVTAQLNLPKDLESNLLELKSKMAAFESNPVSTASIDNDKILPVVDEVPAETVCESIRQAHSVLTGNTTYSELTVQPKTRLSQDELQHQLQLRRDESEMEKQQNEQHMKRRQERDELLRKLQREQQEDKELQLEQELQEQQRDWNLPQQRQAEHHHNQNKQQYQNASVYTGLVPRQREGQIEQEQEEYTQQEEQLGKEQDELRKLEKQNETHQNEHLQRLQGEQLQSQREEQIQRQREVQPHYFDGVQQTASLNWMNENVNGGSIMYLLNTLLREQRANEIFYKFEFRKLQKQLQNVLERIEQAMSTEFPQKPECLPFETTDAIETFEHIGDDEYRKCVLYLSEFGGHTLDDTTNEIFKHAINDAVSPHITWTGREAGTIALEKTRLAKALYYTFSPIETA